MIVQKQATLRQDTELFSKSRIFRNGDLDPMGTARGWQIILSQKHEYSKTWFMLNNRGTFEGSEKLISTNTSHFTTNQ